MLFFLTCPLARLADKPSAEAVKIYSLDRWNKNALKLRRLYISLCGLTSVVSNKNQFLNQCFVR